MHGDQRSGVVGTGRSSVDIVFRIGCSIVRRERLKEAIRLAILMVSWRVITARTEALQNTIDRRLERLLALAVLRLNDRPLSSGTSRVGIIPAESLRRTDECAVYREGQSWIAVEFGDFNGLPAHQTQPGDARESLNQPWTLKTDDYVVCDASTRAAGTKLPGQQTNITDVPSSFPSTDKPTSTHHPCLKPIQPTSRRTTSTPM